jgi:hypothetical protein
MAGFTVNNQMAGTLQAISSSYKTLTRVVAAASGPRRIEMVEMEWSSISVPNATDCPIEFDFTYCSAATAGTTTASATPLPHDSGAAIGTAIDTSISTGGVNYSAEPTTFTQAQCWFNRGVNQRSGVLWQAAPGFSIIQPSTASVGAAMRALSPNYTGNVIAREVFQER